MTNRSGLAAMVARHGAVATYAFALLAFLLPLTPHTLPIALVAGVVAWVVHHRSWQRMPSLSGTASTALPWAFALFLLHAVGMAWSTNMDYGLFDLQIKLPLALLPLLYFCTPRTTSHGLRALFVPFVLGNVAAVGIAVVSLIFRLLTVPGIDMANEVFGERFSWLVHPSYFALYLCLAVAVLFLRPFGTSMQRMAMAAVLCLGVLLCGSKAGWIGLGLVMLVVVVVQWKDRTVRDPILGLAAVSTIGLVVLVAASPNVRERVVEAWHAVVGKETHNDATTSTEIRKLAWHSATEVARANVPWGTGTGDVKDELIAAHERSGYHHLVERRINAHSEYLQLWAALGWPGLLLLLLSVLVPFVSALRGRDVLAALFFLLSGLNWVVESMVEVQAGALFFAFFAFVLAQRELPTNTSIDPE